MESTVGRLSRPLRLRDAPTHHRNLLNIGPIQIFAVAQRLPEGVHEARDDRPDDGDDPKQLYCLQPRAQDQENGCGRQRHGEPEQDGQSANTAIWIAVRRAGAEPAGGILVHGQGLPGCGEWTGTEPHEPDHPEAPRLAPYPAASVSRRRDGSMDCAQAGDAVHGNKFCRSIRPPGLPPSATQVDLQEISDRKRLRTGEVGLF